MTTPDGSNNATFTDADGCGRCPSQCANVFDRVVISYLIAGGTRVYWELKDSFDDPRPYVFTLQVGLTENPDADDWQDVGTSVTDIFYAVDGEQRVFAKETWQFYRVKLVTSRGVYYSDPTALLGTLDQRDWRIASMAMRSETVYMKNGDGQLGYLLKRRIAGKRCKVCLDPQTLEVTQPYCLSCLGTGFECGYFFPISCVWADIAPKTFHLNIDGSRGMTQDIAVKARMVNIWMLNEEDVFIQKASDDRYYVHKVSNVYEVRGVPIAADVELRPAPATDPIYTLAIPGQLEQLDQMSVEV